MRAFLALSLPAPGLELAAELQGELRRSGFGGRLTGSEGLHLTLHFLGGIDAGGVAGALGALAAGGLLCPPFSLTVGGVGAFPDVARPRIVWMGVRASIELQSLHSCLGRLLAEAGLDVESRPFRPHVTLARSRRPRGRELEPFFARSGRAQRTFEVRDAHLYESRPAAAGTRYSIVSTSRLSGLGARSCG